MKRIIRKLFYLFRFYLLLFGFWLLLCGTFKLFDYYEAFLIYRYFNENISDIDLAEVEQFDEYYAVSGFNHDILTGKYGLWVDKFYTELEYNKYFYDCNDEEWLRENYLDFPGFQENDLYSIIYYGELTPSEYDGHKGFYTTRLYVAPLEIAHESGKKIEKGIKETGIVILIVCAVLGLIIYGNDRSDKPSDESLSAKLMLKGLSRDLIVPIGTLKASIEDWKNADDSDRKAASESVLAQIDRMDEAIGKQLKLREVENDIIDLHLEEINLYFFTKMVVSDMEAEITKRGVKIFIDCKYPEKCIVNADRVLMKMVINSMLLVAMECSSNLVIRLGNQGTGSSRVVLGIECRQTSSLPNNLMWTKVWNSDEKRIEAFGSAGAGLAAVAPILRKHHALYGCSSYRYYSTIWFSMKRIEMDND